MIEIIVSACLAADHSRCQDVRLSYMAQAVTPQQCMVVGQAEMARWAAGNPNWQIMRWSCAPKREVAKL